MEELQSILEMWEQSWQNPAMRHAMLVHFPIVLAFLLVPLAFLTAIWPGTFRKTLIIFCFLIGLTMAGTAWLAKDAGAQAHAALGSAIAQDVQTNIIAHGTAAVRIWWLALSACGILVLACLGNNLWKVIARPPGVAQPSTSRQKSSSRFLLNGDHQVPIWSAGFAI